MYVFMFILILISLMIVLLAVFPLKVAFAANSERLPDFHISFSWLNPFITGTVAPSDEGLSLSIKLFNKRIICRKLRKSKGHISNINKLAFIKSFKPTHVKIETSYGFQDMSITGMVFAAISIVSQSMDFDDFYNNPNFTAEYDYFELEGIAEMDVLSLITAWLKLNKNYGNEKALYPAK